MPYEIKKETFRPVFIIEMNARLGLISEVDRTFRVFFLPLSHSIFCLPYKPLISQKTLLSFFVPTKSAYFLSPFHCSLFQSIIQDRWAFEKTQESSSVSLTPPPSIFSIGNNRSTFIKYLKKWSGLHFVVHIFLQIRWRTLPTFCNNLDANRMDSHPKH